jgi:hypothetical protein
MKNTLYGLLVLTVFSLGLLIFRPIPKATMDNTAEVTGTVTQIFESGEKDVTFVLKEYDRRFYINRGLENGLMLSQLKESLIGQAITLRYATHWTPLDPGSSIRHVASLTHKDKVLYSEFSKK